MLKQRINSFRYAIAGILRMFKTQVNARIHLVATAVVIIAGLYFDLSIQEWCICVLAIASVLAAESFNTALEDLTDLVSPHHHPQAGHVKDVAAGGVLLTAIGAIVVGGLIFLPKILKMLL